MFQIPPIIVNAAGAKQSERRVMEGVLNSALFTPQQEEMADGIVRSGLPDKHSKVKQLHHIKAGATKYNIGVQHIPGTRY
jgi:hypothetical protein